jgi:hypothetical protein
MLKPIPSQSSGHRRDDGSERPELSTEVESEQPAG